MPRVSSLLGSSGLKIQTVLLLGLLCGLVSSTALAFEHPGGVHSRAQIAQTRADLQAGDSERTRAYAKLIERANAALSENPSASADYYVPGYYDNAQGHTDAKRRLRNDVEAAYDCALAYQIGHGQSSSERNRYAEKAKSILNAWARVNRSTSGTDGNLVMAYVGTSMVVAAELLSDYPGWGSSDRQQFRDWTRTVLRGASVIQNKTNNQADWGIFAALVADHYLDDRASMDAHVVRLREIIDDQIDPDGTLPREIARGARSLWYTYFSLAPMTNAVELVRNATGTNLYQWRPPSGGTIQQAAARFLRGAKNPKDWPTPVDQTPDPRGWGGNLLHATGEIYSDSQLRAWSNPPLDPSNAAWRSPDLMVPARIGLVPPASQPPVANTAPAAPMLLP